MGKRIVYNKSMIKCVSCGDVFEHIQIFSSGKKKTKCEYCIRKHNNLARRKKTHT